MITWQSNEHGRSGELQKLNRERNDPKLHPVYRGMADKSHAAIVAQLKDRKLMALRHRLIKASQAGDLPAANRIQLLMRDYNKEEKETGDYDS